MRDTNTKISLLLTLFLSAGFFQLYVKAYSYQYWIQSQSKSAHCPFQTSEPERCLTLTDLLVNSLSIQNVTLDNVEITITFLPGMHATNQSGWINLSMFRQLSLKGISRNLSVIECINEHTIGFLFNNIQNLIINNLTIRNCGYNSSDTPSRNSSYLSDFQRLNSYSTILLFNVRQLSIVETHILNSIGFGIINVKPSNFINITKSVFCNIKNSSELKINRGNIFVIITSDVTVRIAHTIICNGSAISHPLIWLGVYRERHISGGITIWQTQGSDPYHLYIQNTANISLHNVTLENNSGYIGGAVYINSISSKLYECHGRLTVIINEVIFKNNYASKFGGAIYHSYLFDTQCATVAIDYFKMHIDQSKFLSNSAVVSGGALHSEPRIIEQTETHSVNAFVIFITNSTFEENVANLGGALSLKVKTDSLLLSNSIPSDTPVILTNISYTVNEVVFEKNSGTTGGALYGIITENAERVNTLGVLVSISQTIFNANRGTKGSAIAFKSSKLNIQLNSELQINIHRCHFTDNICEATNLDHLASLSTIHLSEVEQLLLEDSSIEHNINCRGIHLNMSLIEIKGKVNIVNHTSEQGAGVFMDCNPLSPTHRTSRLLFFKGSRLVILDNYAISYGGGIAIQTGCSNPELCFFDDLSNQSYLSNGQSYVQMSGNKAKIGANSIYGGYLEYCTLESGGTRLNHQFFDMLFQFNEENNTSVVASQPYKVCFCGISFSMDRSCLFEHSITTYPGQTFQVSVVGVSDFNNSFPSIIRASITDSSAVLQNIQVTQQVGLYCKDLSYTISTVHEDHTVTVSLKIDETFSGENSLATFRESKIYAQVRKCPLGFDIDLEMQKCSCTEYLKTAAVSCDIENIVIKKSSASMWIGNFSNKIVAHSNCPLDYCKRNYLNVDPYNQADQCDHNRSGVLCGACQPGLSLMLGSSRCGRCSDLYLLLLVAFAVAGVALVLILLKFDLTVSTGSLNGMIFYINILQANRAVFFPNINTSNSFSMILSVPIAWLNLDLGIETCLSANLTFYSKAWLQFVFPVYTWLIATLLAVVSAYSSIFSKLIGSNIVSVLATVVLLSYAKILRATLSSVSATAISGSNSSHIVWLLDGSYTFLAWPHILLFVFALMMLLFFIIPFTFILLFSPLLQVLSNNKRWILMRVFPIINAYQRPYKKKLRFWTGLLLSARLVLLSAFAGNILGNPDIDIMLILLATIILIAIWWRVGHVYQVRLNDYLEIFYLTNLAFTSTITLYLHASMQNAHIQEAIICTTVSMAFMVFLLTLCNNFCQKFSETSKGKQIIHRLKDIFHRQADTPEEHDTVPIVQAPTEPTVTLVDIKKNQEPLLQSDDSQDD